MEYYYLDVLQAQDKLEKEKYLTWVDKKFDSACKLYPVQTFKFDTSKDVGKIREREKRSL